jgi:hypothetical protein
VCFADAHDARALTAMLGGCDGFRSDQGVARTVAGMPPRVAAEDAAVQHAELLCFRQGFAGKVGVRVGADIDVVLRCMAGARWASQIAANHTQAEAGGGR